MAKSDGLNEVGDKNLIIQNDRLATATQKKMPKNPQIVFVKNTNTHKYPQKSRKSRKFAKMVKSDGLNEVGDKNLIFQNDRLANATRKIKKKCQKIPKSYL